MLYDLTAVEICYDRCTDRDVEEGGSVQVIQKLSNGLIIGANGERFAMGNEIADRIQV